MAPSHYQNQCWLTIPWHINQDGFFWKKDYKWQMKCKVAKSHCKTIGENKNKTNWDTYVVIYTKGYYQCLFYRIRKLFSGDVIPLWVFEICKFEITDTSPRGQLLNATRNPSRSHCQPLSESMLTQVYVANRPKVKLESILNPPED